MTALAIDESLSSLAHFKVHFNFSSICLLVLIKILKKEKEKETVSFDTLKKTLKEGEEEGRI